MLTYVAVRYAVGLFNDVLILSGFSIFGLTEWHKIKVMDTSY
jgi:hypothetical protein